MIIATFAAFQLEAHPECNYDFLQIHDGLTASSHMLGKYCGGRESIPNNGVINSTHNALYLWFKSDDSNTGDGFTIHWTSAQPGRQTMLMLFKVDIYPQQILYLALSSMYDCCTSLWWSFGRIGQ